MISEYSVARTMIKILFMLFEFNDLTTDNDCPLYDKK